MDHIYIYSNDIPALKIRILSASNNILRERKRLYALLARYDPLQDITEDMEVTPFYPLERLKWRKDYDPSEIIVLLGEEVIAFNKELTHNPMVRDMPLLYSAVDCPFQSFGGMEFFPSLYDKAARLCYALIENHPFIDGNKRTAVHAMLVFLKINGVKIIASDEELYIKIMNLTKGELTVEAFASWIKRNYTLD